MDNLGPLYNTYSIVGYDPITNDLGIAVATKYIAVGSSVPFAKPEVGAIAIQAYANPKLGPEGWGISYSFGNWLIKFFSNKFYNFIPLKIFSN